MQHENTNKESNTDHALCNPIGVELTSVCVCACV